LDALARVAPLDGWLFCLDAWIPFSAFPVSGPGDNDPVTPGGQGGAIVRLG
jgi:hypothetical protein